jgi:hypothetical protein
LFLRPTKYPRPKRLFCRLFLRPTKYPRQKRLFCRLFPSPTKYPRQKRLICRLFLHRKNSILLLGLRIPNTGTRCRYLTYRAKLSHKQILPYLSRFAIHAINSGIRVHSGE